MKANYISAERHEIIGSDGTVYGTIQEQDGRLVYMPDSAEYVYTPAMLRKLADVLESVQKMADTGAWGQGG